MGPLAGTTVIEIAALGPAPICGMILADFGAEVILVERESVNPNALKVTADHSRSMFYKRGKKSIVLDLKQAQGVDAILRLCESADVLIEGFRPGAMERLGLGPDVCLARNKRLVYGRQTGWGQTGPLAHAAGHDINYVALAGALYYTGHDGEAPFTPPTVVGDIGGGAMTFAFGILAALQHANKTGEGQVIDAAVTDGTTYMMTLLASARQMGLLAEPRGSSVFSGGAPWYQSFECADGEYITVGSLEPNFYRLLLEKCDLQNDPDFAEQFSTKDWPRAINTLGKLFRQKTRADWCDLLEGSDVCFAPVLNLDEASKHPHNLVRETFVNVDGNLQPAPAPKLSRTPARAGSVAEVGERIPTIYSILSPKLKYKTHQEGH